MSKKQEKLAFRGLGWAENSKNWLSEGSDEQKTRKNGFPRPRTSRKWRKSTFGHGRRVKNDKNSVSAMAGKRKTAKTAFRPRPKLKKRLKLAFQPLGWAENWRNRLSNPLDEQKTEEIGFPTPWMSRKLKKWLSNPLDEQKIEKTGFPTPWKREDRRLNRINNNGQETIWRHQTL